MDLIWTLIALTAVLFIIFITVLVLYFRKSKNKQDKTIETASTSGTKQKQENLDLSICLAELQHQKDIIKLLADECDPEDEKRLMLFQCWELFLNVEYDLISTQSLSADIDTALEQFLPLTEDVNFAQSMDTIVKKIAAQKKLSTNMMQEIERKNSILLTKTEASNQLNSKLESLRAELSKEEAVDKALLDARLELATLWQLESRIKEELAHVDLTHENTTPEYRSALEDFLSNSDIDDFMSPIQEEYQNKVNQLKSMADYQKTIIEELKSAIKEVSSQDPNSSSLNYDVAVARLEKTFINKKAILHKLEAKLDSLQAIKQNLTLDSQAQNALIIAKEAELNTQIPVSDANEKSAIQSILEQQQTSVQAMEDLFDQAPLIKESELLVEKQSSKIEKVKRMVNESELFVELLEQDLDVEQKRQDDLQLRLSNLSESLLDNPSITKEDRDQIEVLKEENEELEAEINAMEKELLTHKNTAPNEESIKLQSKVEELNEKIIKMKEDYANMEEKYLSALL